MADDDYTRQAMHRERIAAQESIARERMRTAEAIAQDRGSRSLALQDQRLDHQRQSREMQSAAKVDAARITGQYDIDLARLQHEQLPERLAIEHEFAALASELAKDEILHEAGVRALFSVAEFAAKAEINGHFDAARDERQFGHAIELEKLRQQGLSRGTPEGKAPSAGELAAWYERTGRDRS